MRTQTLQVWQDIVKTALVGTERQEPTFANVEEPMGELLAQLGSADKEQTLLRASGLVAGYRRAGYRPARAENTLASPAEADARPSAPPQVVSDLLTMLRGECREALSEWMQTAAGHGWRVPEEHLSELLGFGTGHAEYRSELLPLLGKRGRWLAVQNAEWKYALQISLFEIEQAPELAQADADPGVVWQTGTQEERTELLRRLRRSNPAPARKLLESTWHEEPPELRAVFLAALETGIEMEDEPFLESVLDDRRKEVRTVAQELLRRLPDSRLCLRLWERCGQLVRLKKVLIGRESIAVDLPTECDKEMIRDGIEPRVASGAGGPKAWWLLQMIKSIPLSKWPLQWRRTPVQIVAAAANTRASGGEEWKRTLIEAWTAALARDRDPEWASALFDVLVRDEKAFPSLTIPWADLLPAGQFEEGVLSLLVGAGPDSWYRDEVQSLLSQYHTTWSPSFARKLLERAMVSSSDYSAALNLIRYAPSIPAEVREEFTATWTKLAENNPYINNQLNRHLALEEFRNEMRRKFRAVTES